MNHHNINMLTVDLDEECARAATSWPTRRALLLLRRHSGMGLTYANGQLLATTHIAMLSPDGQFLRIPRRTEYILLEIGCSDWDTLDETEIDRHRGRGFLVSFEPLLDKYAVLLARGTQRFHGTQHDMAVPLAHHHRSGVVLPLAVSPRGGPVNITVHKRAGCSSLLRANRTATATWGRLCNHVLETRHVESLSLLQAMRLAGPPSMPIRFLKIDAQGKPPTPPTLLTAKASDSALPRAPDFLKANVARLCCVCNCYEIRCRPQVDQGARAGGARFALWACQ